MNYYLFVVVVSTGVSGAGMEVVSGVGTVSTSVVIVVESVTSVSLVSGACLQENTVNAVTAKNNARNVVVLFMINKIIVPYKPTSFTDSQAYIIIGLHYIISIIMLNTYFQMNYRYDPLSFYNQIDCNSNQDYSQVKEKVTQ